MSNVLITGANSGIGLLTLPYTSAYAASKGVFPTRFNANTVAAPNFNEGSPHWDNALRYRGALQASIEVGHAGADPHEVADLVFELLRLGLTDWATQKDTTGRPEVTLQ